MLMKNLKIISLFTVVSSLFLLSGCTSNQTIGGNTHDLFTKYEYGDRWKTLVEDEVVTFGKPTTFLVNEPKDICRAPAGALQISTGLRWLRFFQFN